MLWGNRHHNPVAPPKVARRLTGSVDTVPERRVACKGIDGASNEGPFPAEGQPGCEKLRGGASDLPRRAWDHREGIVEGFTGRYDRKRLVQGSVRCG